MDIITGQRTFCVAVSALGSDGISTLTEIPFVDTAGNNINCNYFKMSVANGSINARGAVVAELSGVSKAGNMEDLAISALAAAPAASGICGIGVIYAGFDVVDAYWHGSNGEICNGVKLQVNHVGTAGDGNTLVLMEYGNLLPYNILKSDSYNAGQ